MTRCLSVRLQLCAQMMEDALSAMEGNVALRLDRIEHRLESMELLVSLDIFFRGLPGGPKKSLRTTYIAWIKFTTKNIFVNFTAESCCYFKL